MHDKSIMEAHVLLYKLGFSQEKNVLGGVLQSCCHSPKTGYFRDGYCRTDDTDFGSHVICAEVTAGFLEFSKSRGNDLTTPRPEYNFPGLKPGDRWCVCALRWKEAFKAGCAPKVILESLARYRPVIIFAHTGAFFSGHNELDDVVSLATSAAKRGYTAVNINYRLGLNVLSTYSGERAVYRATQDGSAAIRFLREYSDIYNLDPNSIFMWGTSAGAFVGLHLSYLDEEDRPEATYGSGDDPERVLPKFINIAKQGGEISVLGHDNCLDFTHVSDVVQAVRLIIENKQKSVNHTFNVSYGQSHALDIVADFICTHVKSGTYKVTQAANPYGTPCDHVDGATKTVRTQVCSKGEGMRKLWKANWNAKTKIR